jgi:hypothetical protein
MDINFTASLLPIGYCGYITLGLNIDMSDNEFSKEI